MKNFLKTFVITLKNNIRSIESSNKTIYSALKHGMVDVQKFTATEPSDWKIVLSNGNNTTFNEYPNPDAVGACFASHYRLWKHCVHLNEPILILEHDALFVDSLPSLSQEEWECITFGRPSYIKMSEVDHTSIPQNGLSELKTPHMLGHHAYALTPKSAKEFIRDVQSGERPLEPNDLWMTKEHYPHLLEYYPFPIIADTEFSTVQGVPTNERLVSEYNKQPTMEQFRFIKKYYPQCFDRQSLEFIKP